MIVDDFSNSASGWPVQETNYWSYAYLNGEYRLYAKGEAIAAVSRGDHPAGQFSIEVDARRPSGVDGFFGLILGLTDDGSEFYTFEAYPGLHIGVIGHQLNDDWTMIGYASSDTIQAGQGINHLKVETSTSSGYTASFSVNGAYIGSVSLPYGPTTARRVGLTATSEAAGFDVRFDNFKLVPEVCPAYSLTTAQGTQAAPRLLFESTRLKNLDLH
jgi:hypothetical protein